MYSVSDNRLIMNCEKVSLTDNPTIENNEISESPSSSVPLDIAKDHSYSGSKSKVKHIKIKKHGNQLVSLKTRIKKKNDLKNLNKNTQLHKKQFSERIERSNDKFICKRCDQVFNTKAAAYFHSRKEVCAPPKKKKKKFHKTCTHPDCLETFSTCDEFQAYKFS